MTSKNAALKMADDARGRSQSNWDADYAGSANLPVFLDVRTLSNTIYLAFRIHFDEGRIAEAATSSATGLALAASFRQEPNILPQLIRMALGRQHFEGVQRLVIESEPSKAALEELARRLAENRTPDPMNAGLLPSTCSALTTAPLPPDRDRPAGPVRKTWIRERRVWSWCS